MEKSAAKKLLLRREFSSGGCVYRKLITENRKQYLWLLGKHSGYHKWVLPKGMIEKGEKGIETAVRETEEEMGVKAIVVGTKPIHKEEYFFVAELKDSSQESGVRSQEKTNPIRRVKTYQEDGRFENEEIKKVRVFKTVTFYLMEWVEGDPKDHGWEMEDAGWYGVDEALDLMAFSGEKEALKKANELMANKE
jgi:8-oxo-dGTP pyrophosphatase MutT (NUDIX family)